MTFLGHLRPGDHVEERLTTAGHDPIIELIACNNSIRIYWPTDQQLISNIITIFLCIPHSKKVVGIIIT